MPIEEDQKLRRARELGRADSVSDVLDAIDKLSDDSDTFSCFRGHGSISWVACPSIFRQNQRVINSEYLMVRDLVSRYPDHFLNDHTMFDRLVRMQHFGLPTRLLDVTSNPLVALYFAVSEILEDDGSLLIFRISSERKKYYDSDSVSCVCNLANLKSNEKDVIEKTSASKISDFMALNPAQRLYQFIQEEKLHFRPQIRKDDLFRQYYVVAKQNNPRIVAQNGAFLAFGLKWDYGSSFGNDIQAYSLRIPNSKKNDIKRELAMIGIDSGSLFPEIDRAAAQIIESYR